VHGRDHRGRDQRRARRGERTVTRDEEPPLRSRAWRPRNDTDVDGNPLTAAVVAQPAHGTVTVNANGGFTYTPALNYNGGDSFTYKANDGTADSNVATVAITTWPDQTTRPSAANRQLQTRPKQTPADDSRRLAVPR